jgi:polyphosphate kinase
VEVGFPVLDEEVRQEIRDIIDFQLQDNVKARDITRLNNNKYHKNNLKVKIRAQVQTYNYLKNKHQ